jgi:serine/threonine protein kinase
MAPELLRDVAYYGDRVDLWALGAVACGADLPCLVTGAARAGVTLYVMLVGKFPYDGDSDMQLLWLIAKGVR